jgi:hypothetical protein
MFTMTQSSIVSPMPSSSSNQCPCHRARGPWSGKGRTPVPELLRYNAREHYPAVNALSSSRSIQERALYDPCDPLHYRVTLSSMTQQCTAFYPQVCSFNSSPIYLLLLSLRYVNFVASLQANTILSFELYIFTSLARLNNPLS